MMHLNEIPYIDAIGGNSSSSITTAAILLNAMTEEFDGHLRSITFTFQII
jgi:hypothetical protein